MNVVIALEVNPWHPSGQGGVALQWTTRGRHFRWYRRWCTRGFNEGWVRYGRVAIASGIYRYRMDLLYGRDPRPLLVGRDGDGRSLDGGCVPVLAPNHYQDGRYCADRVWLHGMYDRPVTKPEYHTSWFVGSSACHGPLESEAESLVAGQIVGDVGYYVLIRPLEPFERLYRWWRLRNVAEH